MWFFLLSLGESRMPTPFCISPKPKAVFNFVNKNFHIKNKRKKHKKLYSLKINNVCKNTIPEEYLKYNIPSEPIYPYISVPDNLYTREKREEEEDEEEENKNGRDKGDRKVREGERNEESKMIPEEMQKWNRKKLQKVKQLPNLSIENYIEDMEYKKYIHPSLIKKIDKNNQCYIHHSLRKYMKEHQEVYTLDCFDEDDVDHDLTEYDAAFNGIGPWPSTEEFLKNENNYEFDKTDLEIEYNITYDKSDYYAYKKKKLNEAGAKNQMLEEEKDSSNVVKEDVKTVIIPSEDEENEIIHVDATSDNDADRVSSTNPVVSVNDVRKLYYKKEIKTIREAKEEMIKWNERRKLSRRKWNLTKEEINLLPEQYKKLYFEKHKKIQEKEREDFRKQEEFSAGNHILLSTENLVDNTENFVGDLEKDGEFISNPNGEESTTEDHQHEENVAEETVHNFRLMEENILYTKAKSPVEDMLYEWDDSLHCKWRKRAEEVIRDVIMYDYPFKEVRRPSNLDLYDVTWYPGKVDVFITIEEGKNYKINLFDLKQLVKKIAERLKELEIDEEIVILPFYELVVSSLPSKNILVCRRDWNGNIGKEVICFFKDNIFDPVEGILLGSPSVFHVIINIDNERVENIMTTSIDKIILKGSKDELAGNVILKAGIEQEGEKRKEVHSDTYADTKGDITELSKDTGERSFNFPKGKTSDRTRGDDDSDAHAEVDVQDEVKIPEFDELEKLKSLQKSLNLDQKNLETIKHIDSIDEEAGSSMISSPADEEEQADEYEEDEEYDDVADNEVDSYDGDFDDYTPDE
ncbi:conserved Plasmodium protein, unknown function [Plasmodium ovale wallikeri]|uniref:Uncharacterized protein n=1 Tax=Plasmodium ovale wallikeri TaxID=864142 RepID=A0A1A8Z9L0_PLAOA|nr:conserved Plasmodium protein, unknown function [Plasmodium ovale wallikeri]SBT40890.1 conserved Plasmodium protein, unknown function [Plasmodium ovale wallikeri]